MKELKELRKIYRIKIEQLKHASRSDRHGYDYSKEIEGIRIAIRLLDKVLKIKTDETLLETRS